MNTNAYPIPASMNQYVRTTDSPTFSSVYTNDWIRMNTINGLLCAGTNNAQLYANNGSYGAWKIEGFRNTWGGIEVGGLSNGNITIMIAQSSRAVGFHNNSYGWQFRWEDGVLYCNKGLYGAGTQATVFDTSNYASFLDAPNKAGTSYYQTNTWMQFNGNYGLYWPNNYGAHFYPNDFNTYTQFRINGNKNGYGGIVDSYSAVAGMMYDASGNGGVYREANGKWYWYYLLANSCMGVNGSATSSSYGLYVTGAIYSTDNICAYSDARKKENVVTVENALEKVLKLRGVNYNRIDDDTKTRKIGVIAQETELVLPEVVTYAADVDEYSVMYGNMSGLFIEAFKEQQAEIKQLKELVNQLLNK
jgi:hypothetical protein